MTGYTPTPNQPWLRWTVALSLLLALLGGLTQQAQAQIYAGQGGTTAPKTGFYRYDIATNTWTTLAAVPTGQVNYGLSNDGTNVYTILVNTANTVANTARYSPATNTWTTLPSSLTVGANTFASTSFSGPASSTATGINFYAARFTSSATAPPNFIDRYNVAADTWTNLTPIFTSNNVFLGIVHTGTALYSLQSNGIFNQVNESTGALTALANAPSSPANLGQLTFDGTYLYAMAANGTQLNRYTIATNTWTTLPATAPAVLRGPLASDGQTIYAVQGVLGTASTGFYGYNIAAGTWSAKASAPANLQGGGLTFVGNVVCAPPQFLGDRYPGDLLGRHSQQQWQPEHQWRYERQPGGLLDGQRLYRSGLCLGHQLYGHHRYGEQYPG